MNQLDQNLLDDIKDHMEEDMDLFCVGGQDDPDEFEDWATHYVLDPKLVSRIPPGMEKEYQVKIDDIMGTLLNSLDDEEDEEDDD